MTAKLQIYLLCRDRVDYTIQAIESVIKSADSYTEVVISDNSITNSVEEMCRQRFPTIRYIRRIPPISSEAHFKAIIDEAKLEYLVLFHDDDIMLPNYVITLLRYIEANPTIAAVACNAEIIDKYGNNTGCFTLNAIQAPLLISNSNAFIQSYISLKSTGIAAFPSYLYRREYISSNDMNRRDGGKYSDVTFLLKILSKGQIVWHPDSLLQYRIHGLNDSAVLSICDRLSFLRHLTSHYGVNRKSPEVRQIKFVAWLDWWKCRHNRINFFLPDGWRERVVFYFLASTSIRLALTELSFWKARWRKLNKLIID
jgi:hypothetical protein